MAIFAVSIFIAISIVVLYMILQNYIFYHFGLDSRKKMIGTKCCKCTYKFKKADIACSNDVSPFEEIDIEDGKTIHNFPIWKRVTCPQCNAITEIKYNPSSPRFGDELVISLIEEEK